MKYRLPIEIVSVILSYMLAALVGWHGKTISLQAQGERAATERAQQAEKGITNVIDWQQKYNAAVAALTKEGHTDGKKDCIVQPMPARIKQLL